jgi:hypothetical protein
MCKFMTSQQCDALDRALQNPTPKIIFQTSDHYDTLIQALQKHNTLIPALPEKDVTCHNKFDNINATTNSDNNNKKKKMTKNTKSASKQNTSVVNKMDVNINIKVDAKDEKEKKQFNKNELDNLKIQGLKDLCKHYNLTTTKCKVRNDYVNLLIPHAT